jgi:hypothetical protein
VRTAGEHGIDDAQHLVGQCHDGLFVTYSVPMLYPMRIRDFSCFGFIDELFGDQVPSQPD